MTLKAPLAVLAVSGLLLLAYPALGEDQPIPGASTAAQATSPGNEASDKPAWAGDLSTR